MTMFFFCFWMWAACVVMTVAALIDEYATPRARVWPLRLAAMLRAAAIVCMLTLIAALYFTRGGF